MASSFCSRSCIREGLSKETQPIVVEDGVDVGAAVTAAVEDVGQLLQVGDRVEVAGGLLGAEAAVQVRADAAVQRGAGELADVVDVVGGGVEADDLRGRLASLPPGVEHPRVKRD